MWLVFSDAEFLEDGCGYWSNELGWVKSEKDATHYEVRGQMIPLHSYWLHAGNDLKPFAVERFVFHAEDAEHAQEQYDSYKRAFNDYRSS